MTTYNTVTLEQLTDTEAGRKLRYGRCPVCDDVWLWPQRGAGVPLRMLQLKNMICPDCTRPYQPVRLTQTTRQNKRSRLRIHPDFTAKTRMIVDAALKEINA
jgi:hypothetical protein